MTAPALSAPPTSPALLGQLRGLQTELIELAFTLDRRGRPEAADVALTISGRLGELHAEFAAQAAHGAIPPAPG
jgi:hypothetical protein